MPADKSIEQLYRELTDLIYGKDGEATNRLGRQDFLETAQSPPKQEVNRFAARWTADDNTSSTQARPAMLQEEIDPKTGQDTRHLIYRAAAALNPDSPESSVVGAGTVADATAQEANKGVSRPGRHLTRPRPGLLLGFLLFATAIVAVGGVGGLLIRHGAEKERSAAAELASANVREGAASGMTETELQAPEKTGSVSTVNSSQDKPTVNAAPGLRTPLDVPDASNPQSNTEPPVAAVGSATLSEIPPPAKTTVSGAVPGANAATAASNPRQTSRSGRRHSIRSSQHAKRRAIRASAQ
jgi:hypothetical protein